MLIFCADILSIYSLRTFRTDVVRAISIFVDHRDLRRNRLNGLGTLTLLFNSQGHVGV